MEPRRKSIEARPFRVRAVLAPPINIRGRMTRSAVTVLRGDDAVGAYERMYTDYAETTFEPFELGGAWYALYAPDYAATRVMKLPECRDLGGEDPVAAGALCPLEFFVPRFRKVATTDKSTGRTYVTTRFEADGEEASAEPGFGSYESVYGPWQSLAVGFVAGCDPGDEGNRRVEAFDLSRAAEGIITRSARFGRVRLAEGMSLAASISLSLDPTGERIEAAILQTRSYDLATGAAVEG